MNPRNVWPAIVLVIGGLATIGIMAIFKVDKDLIVTVAVPMILMVLGALLAAQGASTQATMQAVQQQTNGHQGELVQLIRDLGVQLAAQAQLLATMHPPAGGLPAKVESPSPPQPPAGGTPGT